MSSRPKGETMPSRQGPIYECICADSCFIQEPFDVAGRSIHDNAGPRLPDLTEVLSHVANITKLLRFMTPATLYPGDTLLKRLAQDLQDVAAELRQLIQKEHPMVRQRDLARHRHLSATDQPGVRDGVVGARNGRVVTKAVRSPVRPATR
jgi:hypothetical protein